MDTFTGVSLGGAGPLSTLCLVPPAQGPLPYVARVKGGIPGPGADQLSP